MSAQFCSRSVCVCFFVGTALFLAAGVSISVPLRSTHGSRVAIHASQVLEVPKPRHSITRDIKGTVSQHEPDVSVACQLTRCPLNGSPTPPPRVTSGLLRHCRINPLRLEHFFVFSVGDSPRACSAKCRYIPLARRIFAHQGRTPPMS